MDELEAATRTEVRTHTGSVSQRRPRRRHAAGDGDDWFLPQALEIRREVCRHVTRCDREHHVFFSVPGIVGPIGRAREQRRLGRARVAHHVLVMHQVWHTGHGLDLHAGCPQLVDKRPVDLRWRWYRDGLGVVLVEHEPDRNAAFHRRLKGVEHCCRGRSLEPQVVDRHVECPGSAIEKGRQPLCDRVGGLAPIGQEVEVERGYRGSRFGSPVCSRGSSTSTGSGRVAISAASSGSSVSVMSFRSSGAIAPAASTCSFSHSSRPFQ